MSPERGRQPRPARRPKPAPPTPAEPSRRDVLKWLTFALLVYNSIRDEQGRQTGRAYVLVPETGKFNLTGHPATLRHEGGSTAEVRVLATGGETLTAQVFRGPKS
jgi:hypothetical protein